MSSRILFCVSAENVSPSNVKEILEKRREFHISLHLRNSVRVENFPGHTTMQVQTTMNNESKVHPREFKASHHLHVDVRRHRLDPEEQMQTYADKNSS